jgi:hypothetical protein
MISNFLLIMTNTLGKIIHIITRSLFILILSSEYHFARMQTTFCRSCPRHIKY